MQYGFVCWSGMIKAGHLKQGLCCKNASSKIFGVVTPKEGLVSWVSQNIPKSCDRGAHVICEGYRF